MRTYKVERSNIRYNPNKKSMVCTFTVTNNETKETHVYNNIFLAKNNKEAFLIFPSTNEKVYINRKKELRSLQVQVEGFDAN